MSDTLDIGNLIGEGIDPQSQTVTALIYRTRNTLKGSFDRIMKTARKESLDLITDSVSIHGFRLIFYILEIIDLNKGTSPVVCLTQKYIENNIIHREYPSNRKGLYTGIHDLLVLKVIRSFPEAGRGYYMVNRNWFPIGSLKNQESF